MSNETTLIDVANAAHQRAELDLPEGVRIVTVVYIEKEGSPFGLRNRFQVRNSLSGHASNVGDCIAALNRAALELHLLLRERQGSDHSMELPAKP